MRWSSLVWRCLLFSPLLFLIPVHARVQAQSDASTRSARDQWTAYQQSPATRAGRSAGRTALRQWGEASNADRLTAIADTLAPDAEIWPTLIEQLRTAYRVSERPLSYRDGYKSLLQSLRERVTDGRGWIHAMIALGDYYTWVEGDRWAAIRTYEEAWRNGDGDQPGDLRRLKSSLKERLRSVRTLAIGQTAPSFEVTTVSGTSVDLAHLRGDPVLLYFWARWCMPCRRKFPKLNDLATTHRDDGLHVLGLIFDVTDREKLDAYLDDVTLTWPQALTNDWDRSTRSPQELYGVTGPGGNGAGYAVLIDGNGQIAADGYKVPPLRDSLQTLLAK